MELTPKQFNGLLTELRKTREYLEALRQDFNQQGTSIRDAFERYRQEHNQLRVPFEVKLEENQEGKRQTESDRQHKVQTSIRNATVATCIATTLAFGAAWRYANIAASQLHEAIRAADAAKLAADEARLSREQSARSFKETIEQFHLDQRAWLGTKPFVVTKPVPNQRIHVEVPVMNSGKTVATDAQITISMHFSDKKIDIGKFAVSPQRPVNKEGTRSRGTIFPNLTWFGISESGKPIDGDHLDLIIKQKTVLIYVFGEISYRDIFKQRHLTTFCGLYDPDSNDFDACDTYNYAN